MSDDVELENTDEGSEPNGPKALRDAVKKLQKQLEEQTSELTKLRGEKRSGTLAELLEAQGAPKKLSKYASRDIEGDVTEESVKAWLEENGEDFGWSPDESDGSDENSPGAQARAISRATAGAPQTPSGFDPIAAMAAAKTPAELAAVYARMGVSQG